MNADFDFTGLTSGEPVPETPDNLSELQQWPAGAVPSNLEALNHPAPGEATRAIRGECQSLQASQGGLGGDKCDSGALPQAQMAADDLVGRNIDDGLYGGDTMPRKWDESDNTGEEPENRDVAIYLF